MVLLNVLIAQMSYTYSKLQKNNDGTFNIIRARHISQAQKVWPITFRGKVRNYTKYIRVCLYKAIYFMLSFLAACRHYGNTIIRELFSQVIYTVILVVCYPAGRAHFNCPFSSEYTKEEQKQYCIRKTERERFA